MNNQARLSSFMVLEEQGKHSFITFSVSISAARQKLWSVWHLQELLHFCLLEEEQLIHASKFPSKFMRSLCAHLQKMVNWLISSACLILSSGMKLLCSIVI